MTGLTREEVVAATSGLSLIGAEGAAVELHERLGSTNDRVAELAAEGGAEGAVVVALAQESGRGRLGRGWSSPPGGLYVSLLLRPDDDMLKRLPATLLAGLAVAEAVEAASGARVDLKWPNDALIDGRKVAGILGELSRDAVGSRLILGIGVNVATDPGALPEELRGAATSLAAVGEAPALAEVLRALLARFEEHYLAVRRGGGARVLAGASERMALLGKTVRARLANRDVVGKASGLNATGGLVLELEDGSHEVIVAGEVEEVRLA